MAPSDNSQVLKLLYVFYEFAANSAIVQVRAPHPHKMAQIRSTENISSMINEIDKAGRMLISFEDAAVLSGQKSRSQAKMQNSTHCAKINPKYGV
jgi:hypothetical protein